MHRFRVYWIILKSLLHPAARNVDWSEPLIQHFRIWPWDVEITRAFTFTYSSLMSLARWEFCCERVGTLRLFKNKWTPLTYSEHVRFKRSLKLFQRVEVRTTLFHVNEKMAYFRHQFVAAGTLSAIAYSCGNFHNQKGFADTAEIFGDLPQELRERGPEAEAWQHFDSAANAQLGPT